MPHKSYNFLFSSPLHIDTLYAVPDQSYILFQSFSPRVQLISNSGILLPAFMDSILYPGPIIAHADYR